MIRAWLREPLVHFLLAGAALFAFFAWQGSPVDPADRTIDLTAERQAALALGFERVMGRAPTDAELDGLLDRWVREEVLYREALRLGLDRDDAIVRRRLATKMDELATASAETAVPGEATLRRWLKDHPYRFSRGGTISFDQRYFSSVAAARAARDAGQPVGEPISLPASLEAASRRDVKERFGRQFARDLFALSPQDGWQGPVASGYGWHLVRIERREAGEAPAFEDVRERVEADWRSETLAERREQAYAVLREAYTVTRE